MLKKMRGEGGMSALLGTHDCQEVERRIAQGHGLGVLVAGGPGVEDMAEAGAGDLFKACDPGFGKELVAGDGVVDVGGDAQGLGPAV